MCGEFKQILWEQIQFQGNWNNVKRSNIDTQIAQILLSHFQRLLMIFVSRLFVSLCMLIVKVPISSKFIFSYLILYLTQWTSAKEKFDLVKMQTFLEVLKTFKFAAILVHHSHQSSLLFWMSCDVH